MDQERTREVYDEAIKAAASAAEELVEFMKTHECFLEFDKDQKKISAAILSRIVAHYPVLILEPDGLMKACSTLMYYGYMRGYQDCEKGDS